MPKIIAIGGVPATGKSTLIKNLLSKATDWEKKEPVQLVSGMYSSSLNTIILGIYEEGEKFPGTDRFSMAVQPKAEEFIDWATGQMNVLFEGDRLFNAKFLEFCLNYENVAPLEIIILTAPSKLVEERHVDRSDSQSDQFKKSRETKLSNITGNFILKPYLETWKNETLDDLQINTQRLLEKLT